MDNSNHSNEETFTPPVPPSQYTQSEAPVFSQPPQTAPVNPVQAGEQPVAAVPPQSGTGMSHLYANLMSASCDQMNIHQ